MAFQNQTIGHRSDLPLSALLSKRDSSQSGESAENLSADEEMLQLLAQRIECLAKVETSILKTMAKSRWLLQCNLPPQESNEDRATGRARAEQFRSRIVVRLDRLGEVNNLTQRTLSILQDILDADSESRTPKLAKLSDQAVYLDNFINELCEDETKRRETIVAAFGNPKWDFRTVQGVSKETEMDEYDVEEIIANNSDLFRKSATVDKFGRTLYALASRPISWRERFAAMQSSLKGRQRSQTR